MNLTPHSTPASINVTEHDKMMSLYLLTMLGSSSCLSDAVCWFMKKHILHLFTGKLFRHYTFKTHAQYTAARNKIIYNQGVGGGASGSASVRNNLYTII